MLFKDINKKFTEIMAEYLNKGYYINGATMAGHQGEVSKIDLTDGKEIIRIVIDEFRENSYYLDGVCLVVGRAKDAVKPNESISYGTIWNSNLDVISEEKFYRVGGLYRHGNCFGTREEALAAQELSRERHASRESNNNSHAFPEATHKLVLDFVKRQPRCKSVKLADIEKVYSVVDGKHKMYKVVAKGTTFVLD